jgi:K+-sensing histidine kinase KdpD
VDIEMLCQQVINHLELEAQRRGQELRLSVEPGDRLVLLDKSKVYQILYHLLARVIETADPGGVVRLHVSRKTDQLKMTIWVSHPWLGEGLNPMEMFDLDLSDPLIDEPNDRSMSFERQMAIESILSSKFDSHTIQIISNLMSAFKTPELSESEPETGEAKSAIKLSRQDLGILLIWQLIEQHKGQIYLEGSPHSGYRYLVELPLMSEMDSMN